jgi:uncharacterized protein (TIGR03083 family)
MLATPRYDGPAIISMTGEPGDQRAPFARQRRRLQALLADLAPDDWSVASRCHGWSVRDVVAHLVGVNIFWQASVQAGLAGAPTRVLVGFDPAVTPALMVGAMGELEAAEVLEQFVDSNLALLAVLDGLDDHEWMATAESPVGHVPVRVLVHHALWDCWVHERDIALPLGMNPSVEPDELRSCLRYVSALSPAFALSSGQTVTDVFAVEASDPADHFVVDVADVVAVREGDGRERADAVCLRGDSVTLIEALSVRTPLPASTPIPWRELLRGLATAFDVEVGA